MVVMDYVYFFGFIAILIVAYIFVTRAENNNKKKFKKHAYQLLDEANPNPREVKTTIRHLGLYRGRWRKDREISQLIDRLIAKLRKTEESAEPSQGSV
jgi:hypothetical protein